MHDPIATTGIWVKQMLQGHLNYYAVAATESNATFAQGSPLDGTVASTRYRAVPRRHYAGGENPITRLFPHLGASTDIAVAWVRPYGQFATMPRR